VGEVAERAFADFAGLAIALAEQDGGGRVPVGDGLDIHGLLYAGMNIIASELYIITWLHFWWKISSFCFISML
jgi:hypothetical protein